MTVIEALSTAQYPNDRRGYYAARFKLTAKQRKLFLTWESVDQLDNCADDSARRILLGKGERA
jgi:hypothetical protein